VHEVTTPTIHQEQGIGRTNSLVGGVVNIQYCDFGCTKSLLLNE
jgi:hypothetical protein